jgi:hypothetical protein
MGCLVFVKDDRKLDVGFIGERIEGFGRWCISGWLNSGLDDGVGSCSLVCRVRLRRFGGICPLVLWQVNGNLIKKVARVGCKRSINGYTILQVNLNSEFWTEVGVSTICVRSVLTYKKPLSVRYIPLSLYFRATGDVASGFRSSRSVSGSSPSSCSSRATFLRHFLS